MTKEGVFVVVLLIVFIAVLPSTMEGEKKHRLEEQENCYSAIGVINISKEIWEDGYYHAYRNDVLVCAHGKVNATGLSEKYSFIGGFFGNGITIEELT